MPTKCSNTSMYGMSRATSRPIYGEASVSCLGCEPNVPYIDTLVGLITLLTALKTSVRNFYDPAAISVPLTGSFGVQGTISVGLFTRLRWGKLYRGLYGKFDITDIVHINLLKDIYLSLGYDWQIDPWLRAWTPPPSS